jgi:hypothetical protein
MRASACYEGLPLKVALKVFYDGENRMGVKEDKDDVMPGPDSWKARLYLPSFLNSFFLTLGSRIIGSPK